MVEQVVKAACTARWQLLAAATALIALVGPAQADVAEQILKAVDTAEKLLLWVGVALLVLSALQPKNLFGAEFEWKRHNTLTALILGAVFVLLSFPEARAWIPHRQVDVQPHEQSARATALPKLQFTVAQLDKINVIRDSLSSGYESAETAGNASNLAQCKFSAKLATDNLGEGGGMLDRLLREDAKLSLPEKAW